jgi:hypothetical protein
MALTRPRANQINTVITNVTDPLIVLNNGSTSANIDIGLIMNRNSGSIANVALFWDESANTFVTAYTSDSGIVNSNISISQYANLKVHTIFGNIGGLSDVYVSGSLIPSANVTYDLGTPTQRWRDGYFSGNTIYIGSERMSVDSDGKWSFTSKGASVDLGAETDFNPPRINSSGNVSAASFNFANGTPIMTVMMSAISTANTALKGYTDGQLSLLSGNLSTINANLGAVSGSIATLTANAGIQSGQIVAANLAMKGYVDQTITSLVNSAPETLDTLQEIATALGNDANLSATLTAYIGNVNANISTANAALKGYVDGQISTRAALTGATFTGPINTTELFVTSSGGDEGGQLNLAPAATNTTLIGNVVIDVNQNRLRIFESGGTNRGGYFDISTLSAGVGSDLAAGGGGYGNSQVLAYLTTNQYAVVENITTANTAMKGYVDGQISTLTSNASAQAGNIATLTANAASQASDIATLYANAAVQAGSIATLTANAASQAGSIATLTANAASQAGDIVNANVGMKGYVDSIITTFSSNANVQFESIAALTSNAAVQSGNIATLFANAATQAGSIATLTSSKANIANPVFTNNVTVQGNLNISGNLITTNVDNLQIDDSLIYLAKNNTSDFLDIGLVSSFTRNNFYQHAGIVRDASDGYWKFFANVESAPTTTIDFGSATYSPMLAGNIVAAGNVVVGANLRIAGALLNSAGDSGDSGQYLTSTGTGLAWTSIESSSIADSEDNSSVVATGDYVNISVNGNTVMSARDDSVAVSNLTLVSPTGDGAILSSPGDLHTWKFSASFAVGAQETAPTGIAFKADGTACYIVGSTGDDITQYSLSTPWDITTATFDTQSINLVDTVPDDLFFRPNGLKVYVVGSTNDAVREYDLGTAWDISTLSFVQAFSVASEDTTPTGIFFKTDGTKMFIAGNTNDRIYEYNLSTAWNVSTAVFSQFFSVQTQENGLTSLDFNSDGTIMWIVGTSSDSILQYNLSSAWDVSTATYYGKVYIGWQELTPTGIFVELAQNKAYIVGSTADTIFQYDTSATGLYIDSDSTYVTGTVDFNNDVATHSRLFGSSYSTWRNDGGTTLGTTGIGGTATLSGAVTMSTTTGAINIHTSQTTGVFILGGTTATGAITLGRSTGNQTVGLAIGATASGSTKVLDIGTAGLSGSTTNINIGSAVAGSTTAVSINGDTTVSGNVNIAGNLNFTAGGSADVLYLGNKGITGVNALQFNDPGSGEGVSWAGGNLWKIVESPDALSNASGNLQIVQDSTRRLSVRTDGSIDIPGILRLNSGNAVTAIINGGTNGVGNIGASGAGFNTVFARATSAQYADLAEIYTSDKKYIPGTVVVFGGDKEVTVSTTSHDPAVAGVVSTNPAYLMNDAVEGSAVALQGRVPCRVLGPVSKGDRVVSSDIRGVAERLDMSKYQPGCIIGKSLDYVPNGEIATIEVVVGRV